MGKEIVNGFIWVIGSGEDLESFGELRELTKSKVRELLSVKEVYEVEEMYTDRELNTEWVNVEGVDYGFKWLGCNDEEEVKRSLTGYFKEIVNYVKREENIYYMEGTIEGKKSVILTGLEDVDGVELVHYKVVYS